MKKYTIKHTDGTTKQVFENELSQYGLELPKAKSGKKLPKAVNGLKPPFTQNAPQLNFNTNFSPTAQDYDNFDERDYNNPQGTYQPSSYAPTDNQQNFNPYSISDPYNIGESVNGNGQQRTPYLGYEMPKLDYKQEINTPQSLQDYSQNDTARPELTKQKSYNWTGAIPNFTGIGGNEFRDFYEASKITRGMQSTDKDAPNYDPNRQRHLDAETTGMVGAGSKDAIRGTETVANIFSTGINNINVKKSENSQKEFALRNTAPINTSLGDSRYGTTPAYSKHGGKIKIAKNGTRQNIQIDEMPVQTQDLIDHNNPNVNVEGGEIIANTSDPNTDSLPTVTEVNGGSHASQDNGTSPELNLNLNEGSVILSKALGNTVGNFMDKMPMIANVLQEKYKDPNKKISWAQVAKPFETKQDEIILAKLKKEGAKNIKVSKEYKDSSTNTNFHNIDKTTAKLNAATKEKELKLLEANAQKVENTIRTKAEIVSNIIYPSLKKAKDDGEYGKNIQNESLSQAKYGKKINVPKAEFSLRLPKDKTWSRKKRNDIDYTQGVVTTTPNNVTTTDVAQNEIIPTTTPVTTNQVINNTPVIGANMYNDKGEYWNTGYNNLPLESLRSLYPNMFGKEGIINPNEEEGLKLIKQGRLIPSGNFTGTPTLSNQRLNSKGTFGQSFSWDNLKNQPNRGYYQQYTNDYYANKKFNKDWDNLDPQEKSQIVNPSPVVYDEKTKKYSLDPGYVGYHQKRFSEFAKEEDPNYSYYDVNGNITKTPFGIDEKTGEITSNEPTFVRKSKGAIGQKSFEYSPNEPVVYVNEEVEKAPDPKKPYEINVPKAPGITESVRKRMYHEGLHPDQYLGDMMDLLDPKQAVPYIEDHGAKDALAMSTKQRYTDIQPQLNRLRRGTLAQTRNRGTSPVDQARNAQAYANEYEQANQVYGQKYNADNQIEQNYNNIQNELRMKAGTNKAQALDTLAQRTATRDWKATAQFRNAVANIGNKRAQQRLEDRTSTLYQDMYPDFGYNPNTGTRYQGDWAPTIGGKFPYTGKTEKNWKEEERWTDGDGHEHIKRTKHGGKVSSKPLPKKMPKKR